jgi:hypothetical protein
MRILVISNLYPSPRSPSFGAFVANRVAALRDAGADVQVTAITSASVHKQRVRKYASLTLRSLACAFAFGGGEWTSSRLTSHSRRGS